MTPSAPPTFEEAAKMPLYRCHKEVWALKIREVIPAPLPTIAELEELLSSGKESPGGYLAFEGDFAPLGVSSEWLNKHQPQAGGYLVFYKDGYRSYSPAQAFEEGYTRVYEHTT